MRRIAICLILLCLPTTASAGRWLDYLRTLDLNDYAFGIAVTAKQNPFSGADSSTFAYPYLTSFQHPSFNRNLVIVNDGELIVRGVRDSGWEFGWNTRIQTLGLGDHRSDDLIGISDRKWTIETGPSVGFRRWPIHVHAGALLEPTDRHDGYLFRLGASYPMQFSRGYIVPSLEWIYQDSAYNDYYYSVDDAEATLIRPAYAPGSSNSTRLRIAWSYALNEHWHLSGKVGVELLGSEIHQSPIVENDEVVFGTIGLAYNGDVFHANTYAGGDDHPRFQVRVSAFQDNVDSEVRRDTMDGIPGEVIDIEDVLGESDNETVIQADFVYHLGNYHQIEAGYFELVRSARQSNNNELRFGDQIIAAGNDLSSRSHVRSVRLGYSYSLIRDEQKELGLMAGVHFTTFDLTVLSTTSGQQLKSRADAPLPVVGANASLNIGWDLTLGARAQLFRTDFDHHEGSLTYATIDVSRRINDKAMVGLGYNYYRMKLRSGDSDLNGVFQMLHRGPVLFLDWGF